MERLPDIQSLNDSRGITLNHAGITGYELPLRLELAPDKPQIVKAEASLSVALSADQRGVHMSRMVEHLALWSKENTLGYKLFPLLEIALEALAAQSGVLNLSFSYFFNKEAPITRLRAPWGVNCSLRAAIQAGENAGRRSEQLAIGCIIPVSTLCPCSQAISRYGAHNQRANIILSAIVDHSCDLLSQAFLETIIKRLESCATAPVFPLLKRPDEKFVTETQFENAKFVEDVARDAVLTLRKIKEILGFSLRVEALESIHSHNAWAKHSEGARLLLE